MKRGRTSKNDRLKFINSTKKMIEDCAHYNASTFERKTMRVLAEATVELEMELNKIQASKTTTDYITLKD